MSLSIGIIGGGTFGLMHLRTFRQLREQGTVSNIVLAEINEELLRERCREFGVKGYTDYKKMLKKEDLDGVTVVTPDFLHRRIALDCIAAGKHVLIEKPLDVTVAGCEQIMKAAESAATMVMVDFHKRHDPFHIHLREAIAKGDLGTPEYGYAWMEDRVEVARDWLRAWAPESSPAWFLGSHMIDLFRWLIGGRNGVRVWATGQKRKLASLGVDTYDAVQAKVEFDDGISLHLDTCWILPDDFENVTNQGIRIVGTEGICEIDSQARGAIISTSADGHRSFNSCFLVEQKKLGRVEVSGYGVSSIAQFAENLLLLRDGVSLEELSTTCADAHDGLEVTRIAEGIHKSLETGTLVEL